MIEVSNINEFNSLSSSQKHLFFDERVNDVVEALDGNALYKLLKPIILNTSENNYIRRRAIEVFTECVLIDKLKVWSELNILLQDWDKVEDSFLEIRRLKDLSFFYDVASDDIEKVYQDQTENSDAEIAAEALYHLGLIAMQKAFLSDSPDKCISNLNESHILFKESSGLIENRIDSDFFKIVTSLVLDFIDEKYGGIDQKIKTLSTLLLQKDIFTFDDSKRSYFHISFYRTLLSLNKIRLKTESAIQWLEFRKDLDTLFYYYCEMKNSEVKFRLNQSILRQNFLESIENNIVTSYFAKSFPAEISRINARLNEPHLSAEQRDFLLYIKQLAENANLKKKEEESLRKRVKNAFSNRNPAYVDKILSGTPDITNSQNLITIYDLLAKPTEESFVNAVVNACLKLQGHKIYWSSSEDDRNTLIADILSARGESIKDQTRWSISAGGILPGEIDIFVNELDDTPFSIIEALNLSSWNESYVKKHIDKLFKYDTSGLKQNFILVYSEAKNFIKLWGKYIKFIEGYSYQYKLITLEEVKDYKFTDLKIAKAIHSRNTGETSLYHLLINLNLV